MRKTIFKVAVIMVCVCIIMSGFTYSANVELVHIPSSIEQDISERYNEYIAAEIIPKNHGTLSFGDPIPTYIVNENGGLDSTTFSLYPVFSNNQLFSYFIDDGEYQSLTQGLVNETKLYLNDYISIIYDKDGCCLVQNTSDEYIQICQFSYEITERGSITDVSKIEFQNIEYTKLNPKTIIRENIIDINTSKDSPITPSIILSVSFVSQNPPSYICWAATTAAIGNYLTNYTYSAYDIAYDLNPSNYNQGGTLYNATYELNCMYGISYGSNYVYPSTHPTDPTIYTNLSYGYPLFSKWAHTNGYHMTTIKGMNYTNGIIYIVDPEFGSTSAIKNGLSKYTYISSYSGVTLTLYGYASMMGSSFL